MRELEQKKSYSIMFITVTTRQSLNWRNKNKPTRQITINCFPILLQDYPRLEMMIINSFSVFIRLIEIISYSPTIFILVI